MKEVKRKMLGRTLHVADEAAIHLSVRIGVVQQADADAGVVVEVEIVVSGGHLRNDVVGSVERREGRLEGGEAGGGA